MNETVYYSAWDGHLYAVHPDGSLKWRFLVRAKEQIWSSPALSLAGDETVYVGGNKSLLAITQADGSAPMLRWSVSTRAPIFASPTVMMHALMVVSPCTCQGSTRACGVLGSVTGHDSNLAG